MAVSCHAGLTVKAKQVFRKKLRIVEQRQSSGEGKGKGKNGELLNLPRYPTFKIDSQLVALKHAVSRGRKLYSSGNQLHIKASYLWKKRQ